MILGSDFYTGDYSNVNVNSLGKVHHNRNKKNEFLPYFFFFFLKGEDFQNVDALRTKPSQTGIHHNRSNKKGHRKRRKKETNNKNLSVRYTHFFYFFLFSLGIFLSFFFFFKFLARGV